MDQPPLKKEALSGAGGARPQPYPPGIPTTHSMSASPAVVSYGPHAPASWAQFQPVAYGPPHLPPPPKATQYAWDPSRRRAAPVQPRAEGGPLRVVHVGPCLTRGGAEQWLLELLRFLDTRRVQVIKTIATEPLNIDPHFVADLPIPFENGHAEAVQRAIDECDVMLCWGVELDGLLNGRRAPLTVFVAHGDGGYTQNLVRKSAPYADHLVAVSHRARELGCNGLPATVIYNGIDTARLGRTRPRDDVRRQFGFGPEDFVLGYLGRLSPEKRPHAIIEAVAGLPAHFKALLVGWGPLLSELMELANRIIPGRYAFVTASDYLGDYYQAMDAYCLLGMEEGFSLAMLEAMMCERPLIVTPVGAVPEVIVDRVNGLIVSPTADAVRTAAERLHRFPHWARGMATEAKAFADRHGHAARMARDYEDLLERLWAERQARPVGTNGHR